MQTNHRKQKTRGFSLVELLVVIAVIGIIAAISIPAMSGMNAQSRVATAKHQAQRIASAYGEGEAAGAPAFLAADSVDSAMNIVGTGGTGGGSNSSMFFKLPGITASMDADKPVEEQAKHYLRWLDKVLIYDVNGNASTEPPASEWGYLTSCANNEVALMVVGFWESSNPWPGYEYEVRGAKSTAAAWLDRAITLPPKPSAPCA